MDIDAKVKQITALQTALLAACPIVGISVGDWSDKSTWRIDFDDSANAGQKTAAHAIIDKF